MFQHVPTCSITLGTSAAKHLDIICMLACVRTYGHADMCWYVPTCADMCQHVASLSAPLLPTIWTLSACLHVSAHMDMPTCADMCRHVLTCADMCQHVASRSSPLMPTIWTLSPCWYVSAHADMCWYVPTGAEMWHNPRHLCTNHFDFICIRYYVSAHVDMPNMCQYVPTCADMCQHVVSLSVPLILMIWTLFACWHVSTHVDMPTCVNMCRHVPMCAHM